MLRHGLWVLLALLPYLVAYLAYRGAVAIAHEYCTALSVLLELNRFELYRRLGVDYPRTASEERDLNDRLMRVFASEPNVPLNYREDPLDEPSKPDEPPQDNDEL